MTSVRNPPQAEPAPDPAQAARQANFSLGLGIAAIVIAAVSALGGNVFERGTGRGVSLLLFVPVLLAAAVLAIGGIIRGIKALGLIRACGAEAPGHGAAVGGITASAIGLLLAGALILMFISWLSAGAGHARTVASFLHLKQLCQGAIDYAAEHANRLPPADTWPQTIKTNDAALRQLLSGSADTHSDRPWAMNRALGGVDFTTLTNADRTVLFFECRPGSPLAGGRELLPAAPSQGMGFMIGFADGRAELIAPALVAGLIWQPQFAQPPAPPPSPAPPQPQAPPLPPKRTPKKARP